MVPTLDTGSIDAWHRTGNPLVAHDGFIVSSAAASLGPVSCALRDPLREDVLHDEHEHVPVGAPAGLQE